MGHLGRATSTVHSISVQTGQESNVPKQKSSNSRVPNTTTGVPNNSVGGNFFENCQGNKRKCRRDFFCVLGEKSVRGKNFQKRIGFLCVLFGTLE
jgi:hypothetical protein